MELDRIGIIDDEPDCLKSAVSYLEGVKVFNPRFSTLTEVVDRLGEIVKPGGYLVLHNGAAWIGNQDQKNCLDYTQLNIWDRIMFGSGIYRVTQRANSFRTRDMRLALEKAGYKVIVVIANHDSCPCDLANIAKRLCNGENFWYLKVFLAVRNFFRIMTFSAEI